MKAIVTGGAGFIGSHLVEKLLQKEYDVVCIDNFSNGQQENVDLFINNPRFTFYNADLSEPIDESMFQGADYIFHLAALADIVPSIEHPITYHASNVTATIRCLEAARKQKVKKFVYAASSSCYGIPDIYPTPETATLDPKYPYAFTKLVGEQYALFWHKMYKLPVVSLRFFNVYGPRAKTNNTYGAVFKVFLSQKLHNKALTVVGDGTQTRDFTFVTDVVEAIIIAAESDINGEILNIGTGNPKSVNELANLIGGEIERIPKRPGEPDSTHADTTKAKHLLNWEPKINFEQGVQLMLDNIEYWRDAPLWDKEKNTEGDPEMVRISRMNILITGGAGYVGSALVPSLLSKGHQVTVYDLYLYGDVFNSINSPLLTEVKADIRDKEKLVRAAQNADALIHLACISNDPSFELNPNLGKSINYDAFFNVLAAVKQNKVSRLIYASSSSVYGIKEELNVRETSSLKPLTDYSKFKAECEKVLQETEFPDTTAVTIRPATVCGYAPRLRLDVVVNILTINALVNKKIKIFGGSQLRPNLNIKDMVRAYELLLTAPPQKIDKEIFNAGYQNLPVSEIAESVKQVIGDDSIALETIPTEDNRSYHINSDKISQTLGFLAQHTVEEAVQSLCVAYKENQLVNPLNNSNYYNIKRMQEVNLS